MARGRGTWAGRGVQCTSTRTERGTRSQSQLHSFFECTGMPPVTILRSPYVQRLTSLLHITRKSIILLDRRWSDSVSWHTVTVSQDLSRKNKNAFCCPVLHAFTVDGDDDVRIIFECFTVFLETFLCEEETSPLSGITSIVPKCTVSRLRSINRSQKVYL